jgi:GT2 family glycosyltransferase
MFVSVIIRTYNRAYPLKRVLNSLVHQTISTEQFEVVVVDDGSKDSTRDVCNMMQRKLPNLRYISSDTNNGLGSANNLGVRSARGDYILFIDDDCIAKEDWVERLSISLSREQIVAGAIASPVSNYIKLCHNIAEFHPFMPGRKARPVESIAGANMGFRRSVFEELNGSQEGRRCAEDMELILRARLKGYRIYFVPDAIVTHDHDRITMASIFRYSPKHASITILLRNQYRLLMRTPFVLRSPALILIAAPIIALKVTASIYLSNLCLLKHFWTAPMVFALKLAWCWGAARGLRNRYLAKGKI